MQKKWLIGFPDRESQKKLLRIMKLTILLLTSLMMTVSANSYSQKTKLNVNLNNTTIKDLFGFIEQNSEFVFLYRSEDFNTTKKVSIEAKDASIKEILDQALKDEKVVYDVYERQIVIRKAGELAGNLQQPQKKEVKGKVTDEAGGALPGATVTIEGTTRGVITDNDGSFRIEVSTGNKLVFSFIGYTNQVVAYNGQTDIRIKLKDKSQEIDDVTVVAFAKQKKESVISSISTIETKDLKVPSSNLTTALAGRISGLISYQRSGEPGQDDASFFVRGVTSFSYARGPLILIDGVEMASSDLARLQPDDIATFSIMKDAAATALYGARGANGVILVTTKEGKEGKAQISFRYETSFSMPTKDIDVADPVTYMKMNNEAVLTRNPLSAVPYSYEKIDNTVAGNNRYVYPANDWYNMLFKDYTINHRANFNVSGGGKVARYYIAGTFNQDNGILNVDGNNNYNNNINLKRYLLRSNVNINITPKTEAVVRLHGTFDDYTGPIDGGAELYKKVMRSDPVLFPAYFAPDAQNAHVTHTLFGNADKGQYINPYADMVKGYKDYAKSMMLAQFELKQDLDFITEGLNMRGLFSTNRYSYFDVSRYSVPFWYSVGSYDKPTETYVLSNINPDTGTEYLQYSEGPKEITSTSYIETALNYDRKFGDKHSISGLLVYTMRSSLKPNATTLALSLPSRNIGFAGRFTYSYDSRYFSEVNFGYNGSERFAKKERFGFFPSVGVAWVASNEPFWNENLKRVVSKLKFKGTYGLVGNDAVGSASDRFFYLSEVNLNDSGRAFTWGENLNYTVNGVATSRYANDQITWETSAKLNTGLEISFFDKLDIQVDYYTEHRKNILMARADIPTTFGLQATPQTNIGEAKGQGFDISVDYKQSFTKDFWISGRANFTYATAKYAVYEEVDNTLTPWLSHMYQPISQQWGYVAERLFVDQNEVNNTPKQTFGEYMGGDIKYRDIKKMGILTL